MARTWRKCLLLTHSGPHSGSRCSNAQDHQNAIQEIDSQAPDRGISSSFSSLKGLLRKPIAPALIAWSRVLSSGKAVTKIIGVRRPCAIRMLLELDATKALHLNV